MAKATRGHIQRRGKNSWRIKYDAGTEPLTGRRRTRYITVRGNRADAERELTKALRAIDDGTAIEPSKVTVAEHIRAWLDAAEVSPKTLERYRQLAEQQIIPHLGAVLLQKLRPVQVREWHGTLLASGGKDGRALSPRTVGHAHRVLHRALARAVEDEIAARNVASVVSPPKLEDAEVQILTAEQMGGVLAKLATHALYPIVALALGTGMRRGELLSLRWVDVDLEAATVRIERSLEETKAGLRFKTPKTKHGRRTISLPPSVVEVLRNHRRQQLERRVVLGLGRPGPDALVFSKPDSSPMSPDNLSRDWRRLTDSLGLPKVMFHALRHSHASALIAGGLDVVTVSRRLGHGSPVVTLRVYAHLFDRTDTAAATAIEAALRTGGEH